MKTSRIYPYNKTKGEIAHEQLVERAKGKGFKHSGSKSLATLKQDNKSGRSTYFNAYKEVMNNAVYN